MTDDREPFEQARAAGLAKRHERRLARVARTVKGQFEDKATVEPGRGSVYLQAADETDHLTIALSPDAADAVADLLRKAAIEARKR